MRLSRETVLLYGLEEGKRQVIEDVLKRLGIRARVVEPASYGKPIGSLVGLRVEAPAVEDAHVPGEMLVLSGLNSGRLNQLLSALRQERCSVELKAVVTEQNKTWSGGSLYREILKEHEMMTGQGQ